MTDPETKEPPRPTTPKEEAIADYKRLFEACLSAEPKVALSTRERLDFLLDIQTGPVEGKGDRAVLEAMAEILRQAVIDALEKNAHLVGKTQNALKRAKKLRKITLDCFDKALNTDPEGE